MIDLIVRGGQVVTPQGVGAWDIAIEGERIAAVVASGVLPTGSARVIDATVSSSYLAASIRTLILRTPS